MLRRVGLVGARGCADITDVQVVRFVEPERSGVGRRDVGVIAANGGSHSPKTEGPVREWSAGAGDLLGSGRFGQRWEVAGEDESDELVE